MCHAQTPISCAQTHIPTFHLKTRISKASPHATALKRDSYDHGLAASTVSVKLEWSVMYLKFTWTGHSHGHTYKKTPCTRQGLSELWLDVIVYKLMHSPSSVAVHTGLLQSVLLSNICSYPKAPWTINQFWGGSRGLLLLSQLL